MDIRKTAAVAADVYEGWASARLVGGLAAVERSCCACSRPLKS